jgi:hypothetical protein
MKARKEMRKMKMSKTLKWRTKREILKNNRLTLANNIYINMG